jgi:hypothetical protein
MFDTHAATGLTSAFLASIFRASYAPKKQDVIVKAVVGVFKSRSDSERSAAELAPLEIPKARINILTPEVTEKEIAAVRGALELASAETVDRVREMWWLGLRDVEKERYTADGASFEHDERAFRSERVKPPVLSSHFISESDGLFLEGVALRL